MRAVERRGQIRLSRRFDLGFRAYPQNQALFDPRLRAESEFANLQELSAPDKLLVRRSGQS
jgi:hypothetical protein